MQNSVTTRRIYIDAIVDALPLSIAVIPWGILCGSIAIKIGLSPMQAQLMSLIMFAGAAQLAAMAAIGASSSVFAMLSSVAVVSSRHLLYSAAFMADVRKLPFIKRILIAFLLTDEMFATVEAYKNNVGIFSYKYALITGFTFYSFWNISTFFGIYFGMQIDNIENLGLDFAIAVIFIAMVVPMIKNIAVLTAVVISAISSVAFHYMGVDNGLIISSLLGMAIGYLVFVITQKNA